MKKIKLVELEVNSLSYKYLIILWFLAVNRTTILFIKHFFTAKQTTEHTFRPEHSLHNPPSLIYYLYYYISTRTLSTHTSTQHYLIYYISTIYAIEVLRSPNGSTHDRPPKPPTETNTFLLSYIPFTLVLYFTYGWCFMNISIWKDVFFG